MQFDSWRCGYGSRIRTPAAELEACIVSPNSDSIQSRVSYTHSEDVKASDFC